MFVVVVVVVLAADVLFSKGISNRQLPRGRGTRRTRERERKRKIPGIRNPEEQVDDGPQPCQQPHPVGLDSSQYFIRVRLVGNAFTDGKPVEFSQYSMVANGEGPEEVEVEQEVKRLDEVDD